MKSKQFIIERRGEAAIPSLMPTGKYQVRENVGDSKRKVFETVEGADDMFLLDAMRRVIDRARSGGDRKKITMVKVQVIIKKEARDGKSEG